MSLFAFDACVNFRLLSPSTGFFLFFVAQKGVRISGIPNKYMKISPSHWIWGNRPKKKKYHLIEPSPMKNSSSSDCRIANSTHNFTSYCSVEARA